MACGEHDDQSERRNPTVMTTEVVDGRDAFIEGRKKIASAR